MWVQSQRLRVQSQRLGMFKMLRRMPMTELKVSPYSKQKKAHPSPPAHTRPTSGPVILEETAQMCIAIERSLKELADREAAASDPLGKGKGKLLGTS
ncbi:hypothetical protein LWI28_017230 [Acer negundo]|uniref:Uncharacterized protein n=1 Tax=Acer negundo TaxID=4023 RepID=A0AAD5NLY2_ACENE|nr:hypothetical protein LWI28_017230 [Acer negundo]